MKYYLTAETPLGLPRYWTGDQWSLLQEEARTFDSLRGAILYCQVLKRFDAEITAVGIEGEQRIVCVVTCPHGVTLDEPCQECGW